ncbi:MAG: TRAP transporter small permease subunit [Xanthomonadaceae bacterium]|nr:TRAP transporter small permease subunit [Xanthomonadaceae bacterium]
MRYLNGLLSGITWLNERLGRWFVAYLVFVMFFLLLIEVVARYVLAAPTIWATELTQMIFGAYIMLSGGYLLVHRRHVSVDIFYSRFSPRTRAATDIATSVFFFIFMLVLLKEGWTMAEEAISTLETSHSAWNPPIWPLKLLIPIGALLLLLQGIVKLVQDVRTFFAGAPAAAERLQAEEGEA